MQVGPPVLCENNLVNDAEHKSERSLQPACRRTRLRHEMCRGTFDVDASPTPRHRTVRTSYTSSLWHLVLHKGIGQVLLQLMAI